MASLHQRMEKGSGKEYLLECLEGKAEEQVADDEGSEIGQKEHVEEEQE